MVKEKESEKPWWGGKNGLILRWVVFSYVSFGEWFLEVKNPVKEKESEKPQWGEKNAPPTQMSGF